MFREEAPSVLAGFHAGPLSCLCFCRKKVLSNINKEVFNYGIWDKQRQAKP